MNNKEIYRFTTILDAIEDSDIMDDYYKFINCCIKFAQKKIIPISNYAEYLEKLIQFSICFLNGKIDAKTLNQSINRAYQEKPIYHSDYDEKILSIILYLTNDDFLSNLTPEDQQDTHLSYFLNLLYEIQNNLILCEEFYYFIISTYNSD